MCKNTKKSLGFGLKQKREKNPVETCVKSSKELTVMPFAFHNELIILGKDINLPLFSSAMEK